MRWARHVAWMGQMTNTYLEEIGVDGKIIGRDGLGVSGSV
jgi:hypothetical protein